MKLASARSDPAVQPAEAAARAPTPWARASLGAAASLLTDPFEHECAACVTVILIREELQVLAQQLQTPQRVLSVECISGADRAGWRLHHHGLTVTVQDWAGLQAAFDGFLDASDYVVGIDLELLRALGCQLCQGRFEISYLAGAKRSPQHCFLRSPRRSPPLFHCDPPGRRRRTAVPDQSGHQCLSVSQETACEELVFRIVFN
jgi:hypothetical protein